jgi:hypothetical protein
MSGDTDRHLGTLDGVGEMSWDPLTDCKQGKSCEYVDTWRCRPDCSYRTKSWNWLHSLIRRFRRVFG